ncbi:35998_t:CDS:2, partial [Gigaspora margarita]
SEQCRQFFLELFDMDPSLLNALNPEQRHRLYSVLIAIDLSLTEPLLDAHSAVRGMINEQFNEANSTFPVSEANFILHEWLTSYCNSMGKWVYATTEKKNIKPLIRRRNTNNINIESALDQSDADETDNMHDSLGNNGNNGVQENAEATANRYILPSKKIKIKPSIIKRNSSTNNVVNIDSALDQSDADETDNAHDSLGDDDNNGKVTKTKTRQYTLPLKRSNIEPSIRRRSNNINNVVNFESATDQSDADETDNAHDSLGDNDNN